MKEIIYHTPGKWILCGEHSVLRGHPALVFPLRSREVTLKFQTSGNPLQCHFLNLENEAYRLLLDKLITRACELAQKSRSDINGDLYLSSSLPLGAGLGASASLCVSVAKWFCQLGFIEQEAVYEFSRQLENLFHGESSGVDIAVTLQNEALRFIRNGERKSFSPKWSPHWYLSSSGQKGLTSQAIEKVKSLFNKDPVRAEKLDQQMHHAVDLCEAALLETNSETGFKTLVEGIQIASDCFDQWGLCEGPVLSHQQWLFQQGAKAVKPTGSGGGGFMLSLWSEPPPIPLIECK